MNVQIRNSHRLIINQSLIDLPSNIMCLLVASCIGLLCCHVNSLFPLCVNHLVLLYRNFIEKLSVNTRISNHLVHSRISIQLFCTAFFKVQGLGIWLTVRSSSCYVTAAYLTNICTICLMFLFVFSQCLQCGRRRVHRGFGVVFKKDKTRASNGSVSAPLLLFFLTISCLPAVTCNGYLSPPS